LDRAAGTSVRYATTRRWRSTSTTNLALGCGRIELLIDFIWIHLPSVSEPFLAWTMSGEVEFQEREGDRPWITQPQRTRRD